MRRSTWMTAGAVGTMAAVVLLGAGTADGRCLVLSQSNSDVNTVLVFRVAEGGGLFLADRLRTGGSGNGGGLHSSSSITTSGGGVAWVVNAKSNTVTSFRRERRTIVKAHTVRSGGTTPKSLWVSGDRLYVLNAGTPTIEHDAPTRRVAPAVIRAFTIDGARATRIPGFKVTLPDTCRAYPCDAKAAYAQVVGTPTGTALVVSDTDQDQMVVTTLATNGHPGRTRSFDSGTPHPYGFTVTKRGVFVVTGTRASGAGVVGTGRVVHGRWRSVTKAALTAGGAACWVTLSHDQKYAYISDFGGTQTPGVATVRLSTRGAARAVGFGMLPSQATGGPLDISLDERDHRYLYATFADGVHTFRIRNRVARYSASKSVSVDRPGAGLIGSATLPLPDARGLG